MAPPVVMAHQTFVPLARASGLIAHVCGPPCDEKRRSPFSLGVLRSVSRMRLEEASGPLLERTVPREGLAGRSLLVANAVRGVVPVARLDGVEVPADARTDALAGRFWP